MANARIKDLGNGLKSEAVATDIHLRYNPATGSTQIDFHYQDIVTLEDGTTVPGFTNGLYDVISIDLSALGTTFPGAGLIDPVNGTKLDFTSGYGIFTIFKALTDKLYNDRAANASGPV